MSRMTPFPACTAKGLAGSCATSKYAAPSRYASRAVAPYAAGTRSLESTPKRIRVPSANRIAARCPRAVVNSRIAGRRRDDSSHQSAAAPATSARTAAMRREALVALSQDREPAAHVDLDRLHRDAHRAGDFGVAHLPPPPQRERQATPLRETVQQPLDRCLKLS